LIEVWRPGFRHVGHNLQLARQFAAQFTSGAAAAQREFDGFGVEALFDDAVDRRRGRLAREELAVRRFVTRDREFVRFAVKEATVKVTRFSLQ